MFLTRPNDSHVLCKSFVTIHTAISTLQSTRPFQSHPNKNRHLSYRFVSTHTYFVYWFKDLKLFAMYKSNFYRIVKSYNIITRHERLLAYLTQQMQTRPHSRKGNNCLLQNLAVYSLEDPKSWKKCHII